MVHCIYWGVTGYNFPFLSLKTNFVLENNGDPDEMLHDLTFHFGLHCLPKYPFRHFWSTKGLIGYCPGRNMTTRPSIPMYVRYVWPTLTCEFGQNLMCWTVYIILSMQQTVVQIWLHSCAIYKRCSGSVVECLTRDREAAGSSLTGVTALCPWARHIYPSLVLVQPRKTRPCLTERLLMGRKESNQINKSSAIWSVPHALFLI